MPLQLSSLPIPTPYDPAADAAGSADPLGTLGGSERLAEILLPGLTARMWRARLLTYTVIATDIADAVVRHNGDQEDLRLRAKLAFERLFVASLVRSEKKDPSIYSGISRRIPGSQTARRALRADDEPLTRQNFIKGQVVNGPAGVMARLARHLGLLDHEGQLASRGHDLRSAWARKAEDPDDAGDSDIGGELYRRSRDAVDNHLDDHEWPRTNAPIWKMIVDALRPDRTPAGERKLIWKFLNSEPQYGIRPRVLELLVSKRCQDLYQAERENSRGRLEREILVNGIVPLLKTDVVDGHIALTIRVIDVYEHFSDTFGAAFDAVLACLRDCGGSATTERLLQKGRFRTTLKELHGRFTRCLPSIRDILPTVVDRGPFDEQRVAELMTKVLQDVECGSASVDEFLNAVLSRHERVQAEKRKPRWVDRSAVWTLMPGTPMPDEAWQEKPAAFVHSYRVVNAYSLMADLKLLTGVRFDGQDDE